MGGSIDDRIKVVAGNTFKDRVIKILEDGRPRTSRQLFNDFIKAVPDTNIREFYDFSGRFANIAKPAGIKKQKFPENPLPIRFIYGLSSWFERDTLKEEYLRKIVFE